MRSAPVPLLLLAGLVGVAPSPAASLEPGLAARVNGAAIETVRLDRYFDDYLAEKGRSVAGIRSPAAYAALRREALDRLVDAELLWQEAQRAKLVAAPKEVEAALAEVRAGFKRPGAFEARLDRAGYTAEAYAEYLRRQVSIRKLVQREIVARVKVSDAEVRARHEEQRERSPGPEREVRAAIRERLAAEKAEAALAERVRALREKATIEVGRI